MWRLSVGASLCASLCATAALCAATSDERALRQALTIVQLLRAELGRSILGSSQKPALAFAPTTEDLPSSSYPPWRRWNTWYGESAPRRRLDYDDGFGAHPTSVATSPTMTSPQITATSELYSSQSQDNLNHDASPNPPKVSQAPFSDSPKSISSQHSVQSDLSLTPSTFRSTPSLELLTLADLNPKSLSETLVSSQSLQESVSLRPSSYTKQEYVTLTPKKLGKWSTKNYISDTSAPELQQVAEELAGELAAAAVSEPAKLHKPVTSKRPTAQASWHEYLARSTRYAVPLPENHAFCYTDPHNGLCRTFI